MGLNNLLFGFLFVCGLINYCNSASCGIVGDDCNVDIVFVMDSSASVTLDGWNSAVTFVNGIIDSLGNPSNIGIIEFNTSPEHIYDLCSSQSDCNIIKNTLTGYGFEDGSSTNIPLGVQSGIDMLNSACGDATNPKVLVLLTDGYGGNPCLLDLTGIKVYIVKIGTSNSVINCLVDNEINDIFEVDQFSDISDLSTQLKDAVCDTIPCSINATYCSTTPEPCLCSEVTDCKVCNDPSGCAQCEDDYFKLSYDTQCMHCQDTFGMGCMHCSDFHGCQQCSDGYQRVVLEECNYLSHVDVYGCKKEGTPIPCNEDVIIAIDESGSIDNTEFKIEQDFALKLINMIDDQVKIGVLAFAENSRQIYDLSLGDSNDAKNEISGIVRTNADGATNFIDTINDAITMFNNAGDVSTPNVLTIISDGQPSTNPCADMTYKNALDAAGITVIIVGVGSGFSPTSSRITCLVDNPTEQIFYEEDFTSGALNNILLDVAFEVCSYTCPNGDITSEPDLHNITGCPIPCDNDPCDCSDLCFCNICHPN